MARPKVKRRRAIHQKAIDQGYLKDLYVLLVKPLLKLKPIHATYKEWLNNVFHAQTRVIEEYKVSKSFTMPGCLFVAGDVVIQGTGNRLIPEGAKLWVRHDTTQEDRYDVEVAHHGRQSQIFKITDMEWIKIKYNLQPWQ